MILFGTAINGMAIVAGGVLGMLVGRLMPERLRTSLMSALALVVIGIAVPGLMKDVNSRVPILSMVVGTIIGERLDIETAMNRLGEMLQRRFSGAPITEGFVTGSLVFAVGAMAVMGALESGLQHQHTILISKSVIDGVSALVFASTLGLGVAL